MPPTPRKNLEPSFLEGLLCPICGQDELLLKSMDRYPDYVACRNCESQFVVEERGERVMYGKIPASYPRTQRFALQQWAWPEAIARRAEGERPPETGTAPLEEPTPTEEETVPPEAGISLGEFESPTEPMEPAEEAPPEAPIPEEEAAPPESLDLADQLGEGAAQPLAEPGLPTEDPAAQSFPLEDEIPEGEPLGGQQEDEDWTDDFDRFEAEEPSAVGTEEPDDLPDEPFPWEEPPEEDLREPAPPPFGESQEDRPEEDTSELEPAPDMPAWLQEGQEAGAPVPEEPRGMEEEGEGLDFPSFEPGPEREEPAAELEDEEDLLSSLWGEEQPAETESKPSEEPVGDAAAAGLGALGAISLDAEEATEPEFESPEGEEPSPEPGDEIRPSEPEEEVSPTAQPLEPPAPEELAPSSTAAEGPSQEELAEIYWTGEVAEEEAEPEPEVSEPAEEQAAEEPTPGTRYRVVLDRSEASFPSEQCAHCSQSPTSSALSITARIFQGSGLGERQVKNYRVPICSDCQARANARSEEQGTAQLQAHLVSVLVALILVVGGLAFGIVDFQGSIPLNLAILGLLAGMGYVVPVVLLLIRANRYPKPPDAIFVETTLRVPADTEGTETAFEWRNNTYAQAFHSRNEDHAVSGVTKVQERDYAGS